MDTAMAMQMTRAVADRIGATRFGDLPAEVTSYGKTLTLSAMGAMIAGASRISGRIMTRFVERAGGTPHAAVMGTPLRTNVETAAMVNATFAHSTEYEDDSFPEAVSSYTIFPVALALGEHLKASGKAVLEAFVTGYETQARIGLGCPEIRRSGMLTLSVAGALGCTATAAKLLKLDSEQTTMALSLAASQCSGIAHQTGTTAPRSRWASQQETASPRHYEHCLVKLGIHLGKLWYLTKLAGWLRVNRRNRFLLTAPPLCMPGAVGSPVTPVATV